MQLRTYNSDGSSSGLVEFGRVPIFEDDKGIQALKEAIIAIRANNRQGTASSKTRAEVSGGGRKPFRQKGTGMARQGSRRSPILVGGGVAMGPKPRHYGKKVNKKSKALAFKRALSDRAADGSLLVIDEFTVPEAKTRLMVNILKQIVPERGSILMVDKKFQEPVILASRNLAAVDMEEAPYLNLLQLSLYDTILISKAGLETVLNRMEEDN